MSHSECGTHCVKHLAPVFVLGKWCTPTQLYCLQNWKHSSDWKVFKNQKQKNGHYFWRGVYFKTNSSDFSAENIKCLLEITIPWELRRYIFGLNPSDDLFGLLDIRTTCRQTASHWYNYNHISYATYELIISQCFVVALFRAMEMWARILLLGLPIDHGIHTIPRVSFRCPICFHIVAMCSGLWTSLSPRHHAFCGLVRFYFTWTRSYDCRWPGISFNHTL